MQTFALFIQVPDQVQQPQREIANIMRNAADIVENQQPISAVPKQRTLLMRLVEWSLTPAPAEKAA